MRGAAAMALLGVLLVSFWAGLHDQFVLSALLGALAGSGLTLLVTDWMRERRG